MGGQQEPIFDARGNQIGTQFVSDGLVLNPQKLAYSWADFVDFLTDTEFDALLAPQNNRLARYIEARGLDFNRARDIGIAADLVTANILTQARSDELVG